MTKMTGNKDLKAWRDEGLPLSTKSEEAARLYEEAITLILNYEESGLEEIILKLQLADPNYVMGYVLLEVLHSVSTKNYHTERNINIIDELLERGETNTREKQHSVAIKHFVAGDGDSLIDVYKDILMKYPTDILALRCLYNSSFSSGKKKRSKEIFDKVFPKWKSNHPSYRFLLGMYSFMLVETHDERAEEIARKGLEMNPHDAVCMHSLSHIYMEEGQYEEGTVFLNRSRPSYSNTFMGNHLDWHCLMFHFAKGNNEAALEIYDKEIEPACKETHNILDIMNATSTLYYMKLQDVNVTDRWRVLQQIWERHMDRTFEVPILITHACMPALATRDFARFQSVIDSAKLYSRNKESECKKIVHEVAIPLCEALYSFEKGEYANAVNTMMPLRNRFVEMGGSNVELDIFDQVLVHGALYSQNQQHLKSARDFMDERKAKKHKIILEHKLREKLEKMDAMF